MFSFIHSFNRHFLDTCSRPRTTWCAGEVLLKTVSQFTDTSVTCTWGDVCPRGLRESQGRERAQATAGRRGGEFYPGIRGVIFKAEALFSLVAQMVKNPPCQCRKPGFNPWEDPLEKDMATHSSILAWRIPWTEEPGRLQSMGLQRVGQDWVTNTFTLDARPQNYLRAWKMQILGSHFQPDNPEFQESPAFLHVDSYILSQRRSVLGCCVKKDVSNES